MDLGARICARSRPQCEQCPVSEDCVAHAKGLTAALPERKPRRALPQRSTVMLLLQRADHILLEQRAPRGIWGGLWSLPEIDAASTTTDVRRTCRERYGATVVTSKMLPPVAHGFTHFKLSIQPLWVKVKKNAASPAAPGATAATAATAATTWLPLADAVSAALPAPVRKIIISTCF